jgi:hypothetical protein
MDGQIFPMFLFLSVAAVALFSFVSITTWADARRKEREAYYKSEVLKKIAETQGPTGNAALDYLREEEKIAVRRQREGLKLGGLITIAVGIGLMLLFGGVVDRDNRGVIFVGALPLLIGVALTVYAYLLGPKE